VHSFPCYRTAERDCPAVCYNPQRFTITIEGRYSAIVGYLHKGSIRLKLSWICYGSKLLSKLSPQAIYRYWGSTASRPFGLLLGRLPSEGCSALCLEDVCFQGFERVAGLLLTRTFSYGSPLSARRDAVQKYRFATLMAEGIFFERGFFVGIAIKHQLGNTAPRATGNLWHANSAA